LVPQHPITYHLYYTIMPCGAYWCFHVTAIGTCTNIPRQCMNVDCTYHLPRHLYGWHVAHLYWSTWVYENAKNEWHVATSHATLSSYWCHHDIILSIVWPVQIGHVAPLLWLLTWFDQTLTCHNFFIWTPFEVILASLEKYFRSLCNEVVFKRIREDHFLSILDPLGSLLSILDPPGSIWKAMQNTIELGHVRGLSYSMIKIYSRDGETSDLD